MSHAIVGRRALRAEGTRENTRAEMNKEQKASKLEWGRQEGRVTGADIREVGESGPLELAVILSKMAKPLTRVVT